MQGSDVCGEIRSYNGDGDWSVASVQRRYAEYCAAYHVERLRSLTPRQYREGDVHWTYPVMEEVIQGIEEDDPACIALGVDFIEQDGRFPFGASLKANTARALRRANLPDPHKSRLRQRIVTMLISGTIPREMREYVKLLRKLGVSEHWPELDRNIPRDNPYAMRFYKSLRIAEQLPT